MNFSGVTLLVGYNLRIRGKHRLQMAIDQLCIKVGIFGAVDPPLDNYPVCTRLLNIIQEIQTEVEKLTDLALHMKYAESSDVCQKLHVLSVLVDSLTETYMGIATESARLMRIDQARNNTPPTRINTEEISISPDDCEICYTKKKRFTCNQCLRMLCSSCFQRVTCCPYCRAHF